MRQIFSETSGAAPERREVGAAELGHAGSKMDDPPPTRDISTRADVTFHVDVGDPITPAPRRVAIPKLLGGELHVLGYPLVMVHAEKIVTPPSDEVSPTPAGGTSGTSTSCPGGTTSSAPSWQPWPPTARSSSGPSRSSLPATPGSPRADTRPGGARTAASNCRRTSRTCSPRSSPSPTPPSRGGRPAHLARLQRRLGLM